jgi:hypothetical protein
MLSHPLTGSAAATTKTNLHANSLQHFRDSRQIRLQSPQYSVVHPKTKAE